MLRLVNISFFHNILEDGTHCADFAEIIEVFISNRLVVYLLSVVSRVKKNPTLFCHP